VLAASARRQLTIGAGRVRQAAEAGPEQVDDIALDAARSMLAQARGEVTAMQCRWQALPAPVRRELPGTDRDSAMSAEIARRAAGVGDELARLHQDLWAMDRSDVAARLAAVTEVMAGHAAWLERAGQRGPGSVAEQARPSGAAADAAGLAALRDLIAAPSRLTGVAGWLEPNHFSRPAHGTVYAVMADLDRARMPVDPVTVSWEAARRGVQVEPRALTGGCGSFAAASTAQVYRRAALARAERAGLDIQADAADNARATSQVLERASARLAVAERDLAPERCRAPQPDARVLRMRPGPAASRPRGMQPAAGDEREAAR
jgi:hypothetical protein